MDKSTVLARLNESVIEGHFVLSSTQHSAKFVEKNRIYSDTQLMSDLCLLIAQEFTDSDVEVVIGAVVGGVILSHLVASYLTHLTPLTVFAVFADKERDSLGKESLVIKRGYDRLVSGKKVLVVEDTVTTGGTVAKIVHAVRSIDAYVVGVGALYNRGGVTAKELGDVPKLYSLFDTRLSSWDEADCPLCVSNTQINTDFGRGREFLAQKR